VPIRRVPIDFEPTHAARLGTWSAQVCRTQANNLHSITGYRKLGFHCRCRGAELVASGSEAFGNTMLNKGEPRLLCRRPIHLTRRSIIAARSSLVTIQWTSLALASPFHEDRNYWCGQEERLAPFMPLAMRWNQPRPVCASKPVGVRGAGLDCRQAALAWEIAGRLREQATRFRVACDIAESAFPESKLETWSVRSGNPGDSQATGSSSKHLRHELRRARRGIRTLQTGARFVRPWQV